MRRTFLIAEIGINHRGDLSLAKRMIALAKEAGADQAKFQLYRPLIILGKDSPHIAEATQAQFSLKEHQELKAYCEQIGIEYGVSLFHADHVPWAERIGLKRYKVASRSINDITLLAAINRTKKPVLISTGMAGKKDIRRALELTESCNQSLLYCVSQYPTPVEALSLNGIEHYREFGTRMGVSSHCPHIAPSIALVMKGASVVEHHVCFARTDSGCDMPSSLTFEEFRQMADIIRTAERMHDGNR